MRAAATTSITFLFLASGAWAQNADKPKPVGEKYALLVGVTRYVTKEFRPLPYAERDVSQLGKVLQENGYRNENIVLLTQTAGAEDPRFAPTAERIREELRLILRNRGENDSVLIAFAGHGVHFKGDTNSYFCPSDVNLDERKNLLSLSDLYKDLEKCSANMKVLMVDACRNDPFQDKTRRASTELDSVTRPALPTAPGGIVAFFSCSEKEQAFEHDDLKHGVFFHFVIEGLRKGVGDQNEITVPALGDFVSRRVSDFVRAKYGKAQTPEMVGKLRGLAPLVSIDEAIKALRRGNEHLRNFECDKAVATLSDAIDRNNRLVRAYISRGEAYYYQSEYDKAIADLDAALRLEPGNQRARGFRGYAWQEKGETDKARADFSEILRTIRPTDAESYYLRGCAQAGMFHLGDGDNDKAIADYTEAIKLDPTMADALCDRAAAYNRKEEYDLAIADSDELLRLNPRHVWALGNRANAYEQKGDYDRAIADNTEAMRFLPNQPHILANRGSCYLEKGDGQKALADLNESIRQLPTYGYALAKRGRAHLVAGGYDKAIADFNAGIDAGFAEAWVYAFRGDAVYYKEDYDKAIAEYTEAIRLDADYVKPYKERAYTYIMKEKYKEALADIEVAIGIEPEDAWSHNTKGLALKGNQQYDNAIAAYDEALRLAPTVAAYHSNRGLANSARGEWERAIEDFTTAIRLKPKEGSYYTYRGKAYLKAGYPKKAEDDLNTAKSLLGK